MKLFEDIAAWSKEVFGEDDPVWRLVGIVEEFGELVDTDDKLDALADAGVFAFDLAARSGIEASEILLDEPMELDATIGRGHLQSAVGRLAHVMLKTHQQIKGFDDAPFAHEKLVEALTFFFETLKAFTVYNYQKDLVVLIGDVFNKIVSKRTAASLKAAAPNMPKATRL